MSPPHKFNEEATLSLFPDVPLIIDSSAAISLSGTGFAKEILKAIPNPILVEGTVKQELSSGKSNGHCHIDIIDDLVAANVIRMVSMGEESTGTFESLVIGRATETLDDGEAATIAFALEHRSIAVIDERKATRICAERFSHLRLATTVDLISHPNVEVDLGFDSIHAALDRALRETRMRVLPQNQAWVLQVIGENAITNYPSLPKHLRVNH